jgi:LPPG:FO 2-phospho-L-lactate transferase
MADKLMPAVGIEVSAAGVAEHYAGVLDAWLIDRTDAEALTRIGSLGLRSGAADTIMTDDGRAEAVARAALELVS